MKTLGKYSVGDVVIHSGTRFIVKDLKIDHYEYTDRNVISLLVYPEYNENVCVWADALVFDHHIPIKPPVFTKDEDYYKWLSDRLI